MARVYSLVPKKVAKISTKNRNICTDIPCAESVEIIKEMREYEPISMSGQPPVIWDKAEGYNVYDKWGNKWLDFSSGVVVANAGHCNPDVQKAIMDTVGHGLIHSYCFATEIRGKLEKRISELVPIPDNRVFLLTTGAESTECAIKLARTYGVKKYGSKKIKIITFQDAFHGRTMGSQQAGGSPADKFWIVNCDKDMQQVRFPNAYKYDWADESSAEFSAEKCFNMFLEDLKEQNIAPDDIAGIMTETFQGGWCQLMPKGYLKLMREFCTKHDIVMIFDEVQAGFGRTGKMFGFMHAEITPDIICCGKGISSGMPLSCVVGRSDLMNLYSPNKMTSTHTGNPVCSASALASINTIVDNGYVQNAAKMETICKRRLTEMQEKYKGYIGLVNGVGLAWAIILTKKDSKETDCDLAHIVTEYAMEKGLLFFAPVGSGATLKIVPPLMINEEALNEGLDVLDESIGCAINDITK